MGIQGFHDILQKKQIALLVFTALAAPAIYLGYFVQREQFSGLIIAFAVWCIIYSWICFYQKSLSSAAYIVLGIALRVLLLFSLPRLSDDFYRFIWDGQLTLAGYHPFTHPPDYFFERGLHPNPGVYPMLNSPHYFTVYPPVCQAVFAFAAFVSQANTWVAVVCMKLFLLLCEAGTLRLLARVRPQAAVAYALHPLPVLEICGNLHFEGAMIFFLLAGWTALQENKIAKAGVFWALATASKLVPVLFLPLVALQLGRRQSARFLGTFSAVFLLLFAPLLPAVPNILQSLDLYFREFQFNAGIYYLVRIVGYQKIGWDIGEYSGPLLGAGAALGILLVALFSRRDITRIAEPMLFSLALYLYFAAVVQPWYVCVPLALGLLTPYRFPVAWAGLVALSYSHYDGGGRQEHWLLIGIEYGVLWGLMVWELMGSRIGRIGRI